MAASVASRAVIAQVLMEEAAHNRDIVVLCSDSRGSAALDPFFAAYPQQAVEVGIAEQDLVGIAAGLASCGKKAVVVSPASFLATRAYEQVRIDCAYSQTNVILVGISGGISYGELGMTHHSTQDIAALSALPHMRVYLPADQYQTAKLMRALLASEQCAYVRVGRNPSPQVYGPHDCPFELDRANILWQSSNERACVLLVACGELVAPCVEAAHLLDDDGIATTVIDMYCVKPLDEATLVAAAQNARVVMSAEEHGPIGGLGARVAQVLGERCPRPVKTIALPDAPVICGSKPELFAHYGLDAAGIAARARAFLNARGGNAS